MAGSEKISEISLEETNKLRIQLGLRPIPPTEHSPTTASLEKSQLESEGKQETHSNEEISLEETNRLRLAAGLKPIPTPSTNNHAISSQGPVSSVDQDTQARLNWLEKQKQAEAEKKKKEIEERIEKQKEKALLRNANNDVVPLAELRGEDSTLDWLKKLRKSQKSSQSGGIVTGTEKKDAQSIKKPSSYTSEDLKGLKVAHNIDDILQEGEEVILTLRDKSVLDDDDEEDVLESADIVEKSKLAKALDARKGLKRINYDEYEDEPNGILSKYDAELGKKKEQGFTLDGPTIIVASNNSNKTNEENQKQESTKQKVESIDFEFSDVITSLNTSSDYQTAKVSKKPPKIKIKKKKSSSKTSKAPSSSIGRKRLREGEDAEDVSMRDEDDDAELQSLLASNRRKVQKTAAHKVKHIETPQEIAERLQEEQEMEAERAKLEEPIGSMVVNQTTDFLAVIKKMAKDELEEPEEKAKPVVKISLTNAKENHSVQPDEDHDMQVDDQDTLPKSATSTIHVDSSILSTPEPTLSGGMADALKLLRSKGVIKPKTAEEIEQENRKREQREWAKKLALERRMRDLELARKRERERAEGKYDKMTPKEREKLAQMENREREIWEAKQVQKKFENYKPDIKLEYRDDEGNLLTAKEAYKHLSHQFHGNKSGKGKIEKQNKKLEEEKKKLAQSIFSNEDDQRAGPISGVRLQ